MLMVKRIGFGLVLVMSALVGGCSSDSDDSSNQASCSNRQSKCKNDVITQDQIDSCNKALSDPKCGTVNGAALLCAVQNQECGADGKTDEEATAAKCKSQVKAAEDCDNANNDGG